MPPPFLSHWPAFSVPAETLSVRQESRGDPEKPAYPALQGLRGCQADLYRREFRVTLASLANQDSLHRLSRQ